MRRRRRNGLAVIEFTIVSTVLLILLFGIFELARFIFSMQMLNEVTRKAARIATVCYVKDRTDIPDLTTITRVAPVDFSSVNLIIEYLDASGTKISDTDLAKFDSGTATTDELDNIFIRIRYVRARIDGLNYSFSILSSIFGDSIGTPAFETTLPAESLGIYRPAGSGSITSGGKTDC
ncbi:TadE/TadG family type IV pilus assembly protein [Vibrio comitans]